jgi:hypothetical protein
VALNGNAGEVELGSGNGARSLHNLGLVVDGNARPVSVVASPHHPRIPAGICRRSTDTLLSDHCPCVRLVVH